MGDDQSLRGGQVIRTRVTHVEINGESIIIFLHCKAFIPHRVKSVFLHFGHKY